MHTGSVRVGWRVVALSLSAFCLTADGCANPPARLCLNRLREHWCVLSGAWVETRLRTVKLAGKRPSLRLRADDSFCFVSAGPGSLLVDVHALGALGCSKAEGGCSSHYSMFAVTAIGIGAWREATLRIAETFSTISAKFRSGVMVFDNILRHVSACTWCRIRVRGNLGMTTCLGLDRDLHS